MTYILEDIHLWRVGNQVSQEEPEPELMYSSYSSAYHKCHIPSRLLSLALHRYGHPFLRTVGSQATFLSHPYCFA